MKTTHLFVCLISISMMSCNPKTQPDETEGLATFSIENYKAHIGVLAHDSLEGRMPFTSGETKTISYLVDHYKKIGLEPGNGGSYLQEVPLVNITAIASPTMTIHTKNKPLILKTFDDYVIWSNHTTPELKFTKEELVFAGFGIVAPEYGWNDYDGLDVKGKIVLVMVNDPGFYSGDSSFFKGKTMTYYGRWTYKFEEAARQGAKGCLIIHQTAPAAYPFSVVQNSHNTSRLQLDQRTSSAQQAELLGWVSEEGTKKILNSSGLDLNHLKHATQKGFKGHSLSLQLSTSIQITSNYNTSYNVIGKITGSKRPDEVIIYTAHWDHLGIGKPDETGDAIYNGALDNATGTAALIEVAKAFKSLSVQPERSLIFLAVTAEEQGLLGSLYYSKNPIYPIEKSVANINMDGLNSHGETHDLIIIGKGQSEMENYLENALISMGRYMALDVNPAAGYFFRSDHFNFAKVGIPALYTSSGVDVKGKGIEVGKAMKEDYTKNRYHRPSDEFSSDSFTVEGAIADMKIFFQIGKKLAFETQFPQWKEGSEFKSLRK